MPSVCQAPLRRTLPLPLRRHSVLETASYGTEQTLGAQKGFLGYATHFRKHSVLKTGFSGTEEIFGAQNSLLWYATHLRCAKRPPLSLFAPAAPSPATSTALGTGEGLLWYGICVPCSKRLPGVRDAFSEALGAQNRLLWYRRDIRCMKTPFFCTEGVFRGTRCSKQAPVVRDASSKARRTADSTDCGQPPAAPDASSVRETAPARR